MEQWLPGSMHVRNRVAQKHIEKIGAGYPDSSWQKHEQEYAPLLAWKAKIDVLALMYA